MKDLVKDAEAGDSFFVHCKWLVAPQRLQTDSFNADSGHGGQIKDQEDDEVDGWDESTSSDVRFNFQLSMLFSIMAYRWRGQSHNGRCTLSVLRGLTSF